MASPKQFSTLVQLEQGEGQRFPQLGKFSNPPYWFHSEFLKNPRAVHVEAWLVEKIFGRDGEHIPHVECVSHTLLRVNRWDPEGEAEILIFGRPYYQHDVARLIMNLADYHCQLRAQSSEKAPAQDTRKHQSCEADVQARKLQSGEAAARSPVTRLRQLGRGAGAGQSSS
ncbi:KH domain-containing protein 3 [Dasypus novemcinctus]|uniref:KH domain-containing protein 3 n=1 Tax=Dasypus novemcinctus TaxID=9361 RepID=UPI0003CC022C|nr:KH domain-containing protein 3 [Dasypus novemcinctus]